MRVLVAVASRHGATTGIAEAIGRGLRSRGIDADVVQVDEVEDLVGYEAVVLGSAVYAGRWLEPARRFVDERVGELTALSVWLFSSGPIGMPAKPGADEAVNVERLVSLLAPEDHRVFAGELVKSRLSFAERAIVGAFHAPEGDFRDWGEIDAWAGHIAGALQPAAVAADETTVPG